MQHIEIRIKGKIEERWSVWFEDLKISYTEQNETVLTGPVRDQAELYGLIAKLRDLNLSLRSLICVDQKVEGC
jgi:hypothetical protein